MRDIKFRAWHKENSEMVYFDNDKVKGDQYQAHYLACLLAGDFGDVLQQFTGLQDKNCVDIYEGDYLLIKECRIAEVIFHNEAGCWDLTLRNILSSLPIGAISPSSWKFHTEVIGNIYENPELLEQ